MRFFGRIKTLRAKVVAACVGILLCTLGLDAVVLTRVAMMETSASHLRDHTLPSVRVTTSMSGIIERLRLTHAFIALLPKAWDRTRPYAMAFTLGQQMTEAVHQYRRLAATAEERTLADALSTAWIAYMRSAEGLAGIAANADLDAAARWIWGDTQRSFDALRAAEAAAAANEIGGAVSAAAVSQKIDRSSRTWILALLGLSTLTTTVAGAVMVAGVANPLRQLAATMRRLSAHDTSVTVASTARTDELGEMARSLADFRNALIAQHRLGAEQSAAAQEKARYAARLASLTADFEIVADRMASMIGASAVTLGDAADNLQAGAARAKDQADAVSANALEASDCVVGAAFSADELSRSIAEISRQVLQSADLASRAAEEALRTNTIVSDLSDGAQKIGRVVGLITGIAEQTNLLALNATIEAARAGDVGRGFAVVAGEVKTLAAQTARATEDIAAQIGRMQATAHEAVAAIGSIAAAIDGMTIVAKDASAAVAQQQGATKRIVGHVQQAAHGTSQVSEAIGQVGQATGITGEAATKVQQEASQLSRQAEALRTGVSGFLSAIRAG